MKKCFKCGLEKPLSEFYVHKQMGDGHLNKCKDCTKKDVLLHRLNNQEKVRAYDRQRGNRQGIDYTRSYRAASPDKNIARGRVARALKSGKLMKPNQCTECGSSFRIEAHHEDYSKPLDVVWLCSACHSRRHFPIPADIAQAYASMNT